MLHELGAAHLVPAIEERKFPPMDNGLGEARAGFILRDAVGADEMVARGFENTMVERTFRSRVENTNTRIC